MKKLSRNKKAGKIFGVCAGFSEYFEIDVTLIRIVWTVCAVAGVGIIAYLISALIMPVKEDG